MYPSGNNPGYGVFVSNVIEGIEKFGIHTKYTSVIKGKGIGRLSKLIKYFKFYASILLNYFRSYDCIYVHFPTYAAPILLFLLRIRKKKLIVNYHGEDLIYENHGFSKYLGKLGDQLTLKYSDLVVVPSNYFRKVVIDKKLCENDKIVVSASGGIDNRLFEMIDNKGLNKLYDIHLGFVARLEEDKGVLEFIESCEELMKKHNLHATIIGYGTLNDTVNEMTEDKEGFTVIFGVEQKDLPKFYRSFDLFVFPSKRKCESLGLVGIESMACGTPIIGSNIGGIVSYLVHDYNGYVIEVDDLKSGILQSVENYVRLNIEEKNMMKMHSWDSARKYYRDDVCAQLATKFKEKFK